MAFQGLDTALLTLALHHTQQWVAEGQASMCGGRAHRGRGKCEWQEGPGAMASVWRAEDDCVAGSLLPSVCGLQRLKLGGQEITC